MQVVDLPIGLRFSTEAGWNQSYYDWKVIYDQKSGNNWVATIHDQVVGTVTSINYSSKFEWIGMMLVDRRHRRQGIGRKLMTKVIEHTSTGIMRLDASRMGAKLYSKLGFIEESRLIRFKKTMEPGKGSSNSQSIGTMSKSDLLDIIKVDQQKVQYDRSDLIRSIYLRGAGYYFKANSEIRGYLFCRPGRRDWHFGPLVAESTRVAEILLLQALRSLIRQTAVLDVFDHQDAWVGRLRKLGFVESRDFIRMQLASDTPIFPTQHQYAIMGPAMG